MKSVVLKKGDQGCAGVSGLRRVPALQWKNLGYATHHQNHPTDGMGHTSEDLRQQILGVSP